MTTTSEQHQRPYPGPAEMGALVQGLGPTTLFDLFEEHGVPEDERFRLIEEALELLIVHGPPAENLAAWFVRTLKRRCRIFTGAHEPGPEEVSESSGFELVGRVEYLCQASQDVIFRDPRLACTFAEQAVALSNLLGAQCNDMTRTDQQLLARAWLGNARRVASDLHGAERTFRRAHEIMEKSSASASARAQFWSLLGSHRLDQGRYDEAIQVLEQAHRIYVAAGLHAARLTVEIKLANAQALDGRPGQAVDSMLRVVDEVRGVDGFEHPRARLALHHALLTWMVEAGQVESAMERFARMQFLYDQCQHESRFQLRRRWLEAKIFAARDDLESAIEAFADVRAMATKPENHYERASVSLELALVYLRLGDLDRVEELAEEMVSFFRSQGVHHYLLAAMRVLSRAASSRSLTAQFIQEIQRYLKVAWHDPQRRFEPTGE